MVTVRQHRFWLAPVFLLLLAGPGPQAQAPTPEGTAEMTVGTNRAVGLDLAAETGSEFEEFEATAYCVYGITYSGVRVARGIVAADPSVLPIGSVIEVRAGGYSGIYTVMDTGGLIKGRIIDIYMPEYEEAIQFGRQQVGIRVLRRGWTPQAPETSVAG